MTSFSLLHSIILFYVLISALSCEGQQFVKVNGDRFVVNGSPFIFNGFNAYWLMNVATQTSERYKISNVLKDASAAGLSVCRTWAFSDGGPNALQITPGIYNEYTFQALDFVISEARKYNIRLILSFVNNYKEYGGRPQYVQWARNAGAQIKNDDEFYTHPLVKGYLKNHIQKVVTRFNTFTRTNYRDDPTIMAWELMNEPRCEVDNSGRTINGWVQEMAYFVKTLDKSHLLEIGMEGFYGDSIANRKKFNPGFQVGTDFIQSNQIREIDFATIHAYPNQWLPGKNDNEQLAFLQRWLASHWTDAKNVLKKPLVFAEFGKSSKDPGYNLNSRDYFMRIVYKTTYFLAKGGTMAGGLVWQLLAEGMESYNDGYGIVLPQNPSTTAIISAQSRAMNGLSH